MRGVRRVAAVAAALAAAVTPAAGSTAHATPSQPRSVLGICDCFDFFRVGADGTHRKLLSRGGSRDLEDVSRDLKQILFRGAGGVLDVSTIGGADQHRVAGSFAAPIRSARFSPDGTEVAYTRDVDEPCFRTYSIHVVDVDGSNDRTVVAGCASADAPAWSPNGHELAYVRSTSPGAGGPSHLVAHHLTTGAERILSPRPGIIADVAWSPTGDRVAYAEFFRGGSVLHVVAADGSGDLARTGGEDPTWSRDGRLLAYQLGGRGIGVMAQDGTHRRVVDRRGMDPYDWGCAWSPDGRRIVYRVGVKLRRGETMALWTARVDGTHRHRVLTGVRDETFGPVFWDSGNTFVYGRVIESGE